MQLEDKVQSLQGITQQQQARLGALQQEFALLSKQQSLKKYLYISPWSQLECASFVPATCYGCFHFSHKNVSLQCRACKEISLPILQYDLGTMTLHSVPSRVPLIAKSCMGQ